jgi:hypothetical protein
MGNGEFVGADAFVAHQQPAAEARLVRVEPVARRRLGDPAEEGLEIVGHQVAQRAVVLTSLRKVDASMRSIHPATEEIARTTSERLSTNGTPTIPLLPTVATSTTVPPPASRGESGTTPI